MKKSVIVSAVFILLLTLPLAPRAAGAQRQGRAAGAHGRGRAASSLSKLMLFLELQTPPGFKEAGVYWEVSYRWRIADKDEFEEWSAAGENAATLAGVGMLLSEKSFRRDKLSSKRNRLFQDSVTVGGELRERLRNMKLRPQVVFLDADVRIHAEKLGPDIIRRVHPAWSPDFYKRGVGRVQMELLSNGKFRWHTLTTPPWGKGNRRLIVTQP